MLLQEQLYTESGKGKKKGKIMNEINNILEKSVLKTEDLRLEPLSGKSGNYYNKLLQ